MLVLFALRFVLLYWLGSFVVYVLFVVVAVVDGQDRHHRPPHPLSKCAWGCGCGLRILAASACGLATSDWVHDWHDCSLRVLFSVPSATAVPYYLRVLFFCAFRDCGSILVLAASAASDTSGSLPESETL